jgi:hypothetical protein
MKLWSNLQEVNTDGIFARELDEVIVFIIMNCSNVIMTASVV